jgi:4-hydroxybenzoate polyprenyltransferase
MGVFKSIKNFASLIKFGHSIFAMPFALIGFCMGVSQTPNHPFSGFKLLFVIACMLTARNAAMAFNRWLDANYDALNVRTAEREIPAGIVKSKHAIFFVIVNSILFCVFAYCLEPLCLCLSPIALFVILFYSYTKRITPLCHFVLGLGLSFAPIGAYIAVTGVFHLLPVLLGVAVLFWVSGFDIIYALQDQSFDKSQNLYSIPVLLGTKNALYASIFLHCITASVIIAIGVLGGFSYWYWIGAILFIGLLAYQHFLVKPNDFSKINLAFFTTNGIGSIVFSCFVILAIITQS